MKQTEVGGAGRTKRFVEGGIGGRSAAVMNSFSGGIAAVPIASCSVFFFCFLFALSSSLAAFLISLFLAHCSASGAYAARASGVIVRPLAGRLARRRSKALIPGGGAYQSQLGAP